MTILDRVALFLRLRRLHPPNPALQTDPAMEQERWEPIKPDPDEPQRPEQPPSSDDVSDLKPIEERGFVSGTVCAFDGNLRPCPHHDRLASAEEAAALRKFLAK